MVEETLKAGEVSSFPNLRRTFGRSATWNSLSVPPSPSIPSQEALLSLIPTSQPNLKARPSLPPLQPLSISRRNLEEWPRAALDDVSYWGTPSTPGRRRIKCGPEVKLDLSSVPRNRVESTEIQLKRDKFAFFEKDCSRVAEHIYLGSDSVAKNRETLRTNGITHVLNCVGFVCPEYFKKDLIYKTLWLQDSPCEDITSLLYDVFDYFEEVREQGGRVFVHCCQGVSRSTSFVIAYLMWRDGRSFEDAFQDVKAARGITNPNMGFACQLLQCQKRVHAAPMSPASVLRVYRLAPHSPYQPLHLVPKMVNNPGAATLDSRGAFVIHVPHAIYVWIGQACNQRIAQAARGAADQVVRYERAQGPVVICKEGEERPEFWETLIKCPSGEDSDNVGLDMTVEETEKRDDCKAEDRWKDGKEQVERVRSVGVGLKRVPNYDVDFELYQRARQGGVFPPVPSSGIWAAAVPTRVPAREDGWSRLRRKFPWGKGLVEAAKTAENVTNSGVNLAKRSQGNGLLLPRPTMPIQTVEKQETNGLSSDMYMSPSSPQSSSITSLFSTSGSPSPISSLDWSPSSSSQTPSPVVNLRRSSPSLIDHAFPILSTKCMSQLSHKGTTASLAERRGSVSPSLHLKQTVPSPSDTRRVSGSSFEGLDKMITDFVDEEENDLPVESYGYMLLDSESPTMQQLKGSSLKLSGVQQELDWVSMEGQCELQVESTCGGFEPQAVWKQMYDVEPECETRLPTLFDWPGMQKIEMFDINDLDSGAVLLLLTYDAGHGDGSHKQVLYVWVGRGLIAEEERNFDLNNMVDEKLEADWQQIGQTFIERMHLWRGISVQVVREGLEPREFWDNFIHGG